MTARRPILASAGDIAVHFRIPVGTIRRWAHEDGWQPHGTRRTRQWDLRDAQDSYDRRHTAKDQAACA